MDNAVQETEKPQPIPDSPKGKSKSIFLIITLTTIVIGLLSIAFLDQQSNPDTTPTPAQPVLTPKPTIESVNEATNSANWKTYKVSYELPSGWKKKGDELDQRLFPPGVNTDGKGWRIWILALDSNYGVRVFDPIGTKIEIADKVFERKTDDITIDNIRAARIENDVLPGSGTDGLNRSGVKIPFQNKIIYIWIMCGDSEEDSISCEEYKPTFDQILSTFKFLNSPTCIPRPKCLDQEPRCLMPETENMCPPSITPSRKPTINPNQVFCPQDAKKCPDGVFVRRQPPNCEFAPCP